MIRILALITMLLDHIGYVFFPDILIFNVIGRLAFPMFAWGVSVGYIYTKNFKKYSIRLLLLAIISQIPYSLIFNNAHLNICFTLFLGLISIKIYDSDLKLVLKNFIIIIILLISHFLKLEYGAYGILTILFFFHFRGKESIIIYQGILTLVATLAYKYQPYQLVAILSPIIILTLEHVNFKLNKIVQYGFYPLHLILLYIIKKGGF